ncbi:putative WD repeat-containing protein C25H1.08c [Golovinomyces cichoracearum]|uniref:Putative WD repeat-containing protein C25H1.08c n=1 Tax=Golovinomyces cichoracearum TaxID=62708 RepID=A0A420HHR2_9PEZI|nr:putative WD repeat-containing protein C25H1.08c [Golovinomyces cichoracearum]
MAPTQSNETEDSSHGDFEEAVMLDPGEIKEEINSDEDVAMDSDCEFDCAEDDNEILQVQNDSCAYFDLHKHSIFCIAQHPLNFNIVATGGSEGDDAGGMGYIFDTSKGNSLTSQESCRRTQGDELENRELDLILKLEGHTDSISTLAFTLPEGEVLLSGGLDGRLRAYSVNPDQVWKFLGEVQEVEEINWLAACPNESFPNTVAFGANDGSVWVYSINPVSREMPFQLIQSYFLHTGSCTAGSWTGDGKLLATVCEDGSLYVWDVFGESSAVGTTQGSGGAYVVGLSALDQRFAVDGGLFSVAVAPNGAFLAVGGAGGSIKVISLPDLGFKSKDEKQSSVKDNAKNSSRQAGQILADLKAQTDGIETLAFASLPMTLLAAGSVDGSIAIFDFAHQFAVRRLINQAHEDYSVVKVEFVPSLGTEGSLLTSCGMDGTVKRWDTRGGTGDGLVREFKGHRGEGEGGGVLGFVQGDGSRIITAGDDGISLVFNSSS